MIIIAGIGYDKDIMGGIRGIGAGLRRGKSEYDQFLQNQKAKADRIGLKV